MAVITFNSTEDALVKRAWQGLVTDKTGKLPVMQARPWRARSIKVSVAEARANNRARSAKLRILNRIT